MLSGVLAKLDNWHFDPLTSGVTILVAPLGVYLIVLVRRFLKESLKYIIDGIVYSLNKVVVHRVAASLTLKRYCRLQLAGFTKYLKVPAIVEVSLETDHIFVPLLLENAGLNALYGNDTMLEAGSFIRVIGDPGSGKSSAAKRLFRDECARGLIFPRLARFPVFVELRALEIPKSIRTAELGEWMFRHIRDRCAKHDVYNLEKCFDVYANKSGLLVILDGLDEVSSSSYPRIGIALNALAMKLQQLGECNAVVLTMRAQFHQQVKRDFDQNFPIVLSVKRFTPADIYKFLMRWPFGTSKMENVVRIYNDLTDRPSLREMCTNPLVLSMYVAQDQAGGYQIAPDSRTEFYSQVADELLIKRRAKQLGSREAQAVVREQRQRILGMISFEHLTDANQSPNHLLWKRAIDVVLEVTGIKKRREAEEYFRDLAKETGLISEEQEGESFRFIHLTFCEFFCAHEAVHGRSDGWSNLLNRHYEFQSSATLRSRLIEALPFAVALMPRHMKANCLEQVAECKDLHLLALTFLETKSYAHPLWPGFVDSTAANLAKSSEEKWDSDWLRKLHLFLVVASDAERAASVMRGISKADGVANFFRDFAKESNGPLIALIKNYAEQDAAAAFRVADLCGVDLLKDAPGIIVESCSQPPFLAMAIGRAMREPQNVEVWASLFAEGGLRSAAAALALSVHSGRPWADIVTKVPPDQLWSYSSFIKSSLYTDCITIGCGGALNLEATPLLNELKCIPPPAANKFQFVLSDLVLKLSALLFFCFYLSGLIFMGVYKNHPNVFRTGVSLVLSVGCPTLIYFMSLAAWRRVVLYAELLQLELGLSPFLISIARVGAMVPLPFASNIVWATHRKIAELSKRRFDAKNRESRKKISWPQFAKVGLFRSRKLVMLARTYLVKRTNLILRA